MNSPIVVAVGGNSLIRAGEAGEFGQEVVNARSTAECIAELAGRGHPIVVTHGNGPQVGAQLLRSEAGKGQAYALPLDVCVAMTQGEIGYILQRSLHQVFHERQIHLPVVTILTQVIVGIDDPAFKFPTKPIGPFYSNAEAIQAKREKNWVMMEDASRGFRRLVACPTPLAIVELEVIRECLSCGTLVIAGGGGGIPVIAERGKLAGVEAVIDKDHTSALLASGIGATTLIISTDVEEVCLNYKQPGEQPISWMNADCARQHLQNGHFTEGSMKPKIEAGLEFLSSGGEEVIITNPENLIHAVDGYAGTHITRTNIPEFALREKGLR